MRRLNGKTLFAGLAAALFLLSPVLAEGAGAAASDRGSLPPASLASIALARAQATVEATPASPTASTSSPDQPQRGRPPLSLTLMLLFSACAIGAVVAVLVIGVIAARGNSPTGNNGAPKSG